RIESQAERKIFVSNNEEKRRFGAQKGSNLTFSLLGRPPLGLGTPLGHCMSQPSFSGDQSHSVRTNLHGRDFGTILVFFFL
ncbi:hypothetical protein NGA_0708500, partial [Nannochloropsis gaditana CCMP526]|uniref:uncharacterized protein n=1 Tax=Nannochloropsis gaditana (strain CCMP526) TaxID=1093141 RepID=UPI00029F7B49